DRERPHSDRSADRSRPRGCQPERKADGHQQQHRSRQPSADRRHLHDDILVGTGVGELMAVALPDWAERLIHLYESETANQFILYGNVNDRFVLPSGEGCKLGSLYDFLRDILMPRFEVLLSYDLGNGIRIERGGELMTQWPGFKETPELPRAPRQA